MAGCPEEPFQRLLSEMREMVQLTLMMLAMSDVLSFQITVSECLCVNNP